MTEINNNKHRKQNEVCYQTIAEFLEKTPPNQLRQISDLVAPEYVGGQFGYYTKLNTRTLQLYCTHASCTRTMNFRCIDISNDARHFMTDKVASFYITYQCSNCQIEQKVFSLAARICRIGEPKGECYKYGEFPPYGPHVPPKLVKLVGSERDTFIKGHRCEAQGLGIGAFTYYRRVVENKKNSILGEIVTVSENMGVPEAKIKTLREAIKETRFSKALDLAKNVMPESLLIEGHNPMRLLYRALSKGVHELTDEECLVRASSVREILGELSERLSFLLKNKAELKKAVSTLTR